MQMKGHVERCATDTGLSVFEDVHEDFTDSNDTLPGRHRATPWIVVAETARRRHDRVSHGDVSETRRYLDTLKQSSEEIVRLSRKHARLRWVSGAGRADGVGAKNPRAGRAGLLQRAQPSSGKTVKADQETLTRPPKTGSWCSVAGCALARCPLQRRSWGRSGSCPNPAR